MKAIIRLFQRIFVASVLLCSVNVLAISLSGTTDIHDPSTIIKDGNTYWTFGTGGGASNFQSAGSGRYRIINRNSEKCLDIAGASSADGANLNQWQCVANSTNQMFTLQPQ